MTFKRTKKFKLSNSHCYNYHERECESVTTLLKKRAAKSKEILQTSKTPSAMIKETQKQYRNEIVKAKAFFVTAEGSVADQKTANKKLPFRKTVYCFWFFDRCILIL